MDISLLSKYRGQLMGVAILLVAVFHSSVLHANDVVDMFCFCGDMGVDIFFLLSGFGMYYAYLKRPTWQVFYIKRIVRIVPAWFIVNLIIQLSDKTLGDIEWPVFAKYMTGFSFWLEGNLYFWYIPAILAFYIMTPFFMKFYLKSKKQAYLLFGGIWIILLGVSLVFHNADYFIFLFRWPVYFVGIFLGECSYRKVEIKKMALAGITVLFVIGLVIENLIRKYNMLSYVRYDYKYLVYFIVAIPLCILLTFLFDKVKYEFCVLKFLGEITLEIYLLHEFLLRKVTAYFEVIPFDDLAIVFNLFVFLGTIAVAWILHGLLKLVFRKLHI